MDLNYKEIAEFKITGSDIGEVTIRQYLYQLMNKLWEEGESFNGKRPFGNSGWEYDLYIALQPIKIAGVVIDDDGYFVECDKEECNKIIGDLIHYLFS